MAIHYMSTYWVVTEPQMSYWSANLALPVVHSMSGTAINLSSTSSMMTTAISDSTLRLLESTTTESPDANDERSEMKRILMKPKVFDAFMRHQVKVLLLFTI